jgi:aryl-alcohol dehydrogenase-like predicted oxidoreductase
MLLTSAVRDHGLTPAQALFRFLIEVKKIVPLTGTTSPKHMVQDLKMAEDIEKPLFTPEEAKALSELITRV